MSDEVKLVKMDLACGQSKADGFIGVDCIQLPGVDVIQDLTQFPWPFADESVDEINCSHYVEHTPDLIAFMNEVWRILKKGGKITIRAPYYSSMRCWQDPTHRRAITDMTFFYFTKQFREVNKLDHYPINKDIDFEIVQGYWWNGEFATRSQEFKDFAVRHYINVVDDIQINMTKK